MNPKRILLTGASGCIGHYIAETLIQNTEHELLLFVRNPDKLGFDWEARPGIQVIQGDLRDVESFAQLLKTVNVAILTAAAWGGAAESFDINVAKTTRLITLLNPENCEQVIYFSTASILDRSNNLLPQAGQLGTDYIRTKYDCFRQLDKLAIYPKITTVFPTLVLGGDEHKPTSHISSGLPEVAKWAAFVRWFKAEGSFHFIHAKDIATVVAYLVEHPPEAEVKEGIAGKQLVLGNDCISVNQAIEEFCAYTGQKIYFRIPLSLWLANILIKVFNIQMAAWDYFSLQYRHFNYQNPVNPSTFGLPTYCPTFRDVLKISGVTRKKQQIREKEQEEISN